MSIVRELGARSVLDVGCGTGVLACLLAAEGVDVIGVDPAGASLDVARRRPGADRVRWVHGDATSLPPCTVDVSTMTGNVAQVFLTDDHWSATLRAIRAAIREGGSLVFETRRRSQRAWEGWTRDASFRRVDIPAAGRVATWVQLTDVSLPFVSFEHVHEFDDGSVLRSISTLRFRDLDEIVDSLASARFAVFDVRDAPDRPGAEHVILARALS